MRAWLCCTGTLSVENNSTCRRCQLSVDLWQMMDDMHHVKAAAEQMHLHDEDNAWLYTPSASL